MYYIYIFCNVFRYMLRISLRGRWSAHFIFFWTAYVLCSSYPSNPRVCWKICRRPGNQNQVWTYSQNLWFPEETLSAERWRDQSQTCSDLDTCAVYPSLCFQFASYLNWIPELEEELRIGSGSSTVVLFRLPDTRCLCHFEPIFLSPTQIMILFVYFMCIYIYI